MKLINKYILLVGFVLNLSHAIAQNSNGFPHWPIISLTNNKPVISVNWNPTLNNQLPSVQNIAGQTTGGISSAEPAYNGCGELVFYAIHTGAYADAGSPLQLKLVYPNGTEITNVTNRLDCAPRDFEIQIALLPGHIDKWIIIYNKNFTKIINGITDDFKYSELMYSIVELNNGQIQFSTNQVGQVIKDFSFNGSNKYDYGKALSIVHTSATNPGEQRRYLYVRHEASYAEKVTTSSLVGFDQFIINQDGVLMNNGSPIFSTLNNFNKGFKDELDVAATFEMHEGATIQLASVQYNRGENTSGSRIAYFNLGTHEDFGTSSPELIILANLALAPSDNVIGTINSQYNTTNWDNKFRSSASFVNDYLKSMPLRMSFVEFSPNGEYLYIAHGGFSGNNPRHSYLGQIDLNSSVSVTNPNASGSYQSKLLRLKVQGDLSASANQRRISIIEKGLDGKIYVEKESSNTMFCLSNPDIAFNNIDYTPSEILTGQTENFTLVDQNGNQVLPYFLPDAVDQENYLSTSLCNSNEACEECLPSFSPLQGKTYIIGAWVREDNPSLTKTSFDFPQIYIEFPGTGVTAGPFTATGKIIDGWQRVEQSFTVPSSATSISIRLESANPNTQQSCYFDDIRIFPKDGSMKSYVYDPITLRLMAELDERNYATFYEYDEEGKLTRVKKETERGVMTIKEAKNSIIKRDN